MPRAVDHEARRAHVATIASRLIAERGLEHVSLRDIAAAGGFSTTVVTHYFESKRELLSHAYQGAVRATAQRVAAIGAQGGDVLLGHCEVVLPLDDERRETWLTWFAFFGAAVGNPDLAAMQRREVRQFRRLLALDIAADQAAGTVPAELDPTEEARQLLALLHGVASEAIFDPDDWPASRQLSVLAAALARLRGSC
jgi:AcrR family transcriptional regulator